MFMRLLRGWYAIDATGLKDGLESRDVIIPAGWYEVEQVENPFGHKAKWLVVKGTVCGATEGFWRDFSADGENNPGEFEVLIVDELPAGEELADTGRIHAPSLESEIVVELLQQELELKRQEQFPTKLAPDELTVAFLWRPDGKMVSSISIEKQILININGKGNGLGDGFLYPVFHVYNHCDASKAWSRDSGCRVNSYDSPFLDFEEAEKVAKQHASEALASGNWVEFEQLEKLLAGQS